MCDALDGVQAFHLRAQQSGQPQSLGHRDQQAGPGVAQNADLAPQMIFDLRESHRGIDRHWNSAGIKDAEKGNEIIDTGRQHQGDAIAGRHVTRNQAARNGARSGCEFGIGQGSKNRRLVLQHGQMQPIGMPRRMPLKNLDQGPRFARRRHRWKGGNSTAFPARPAAVQVPPVPMPARDRGRFPPRQWSEQGAARGMRARSAGSARFEPGCRSPNRARSDWPSERQ